MAGGFECAFAEKVSKGVQCECPICLLVLREPYQATCCGKSFCKECILRVKVDLKSCPTCKDDNFKLFHNKGLQQSLYDFQVYCTHKSKGCEWTGELRELDNHLNSDPPADKSLQGCPYTLINCPLSCESTLARRYILSHLKDQLVHSDNWHTLPARKEFQNIQMQFLNGEQHHIINGSLHENGIEQERFFASDRLVAPVQLIMSNFEQHRKSEGIWYSPGFYTRPGGYKMCLAIYSNGWAEGRSKCISVYVHLMRGEFDDKLEWPFQGDVHVQLLSWEEGEENLRGSTHAQVIPFDETAQECTAAGRIVGGDRAEIGRGLCKFALHRDIREKYLKNNCLKLCVYYYSVGHVDISD